MRKEKAPQFAGLFFPGCLSGLIEIVEVKPDGLALFIMSDHQLGRGFRGYIAFLLALRLPLGLLCLLFLAGALFLSFSEAGS